MGEVGDRLRQAREAKGLTFEQVEEITRIRRRYLQALEEEDYGQLPGEVFIRGFLRNYALALGLDPGEILAAAGRRPPSPVAPIREVHEPLLDEPLLPPPGRQRLIATLIALMVLVAVGLGAWTFYRYLGPASGLPILTAPGSGQTLVPADNETTPRPTFTVPPSPSPGVTSTPEPTDTPEATATPEATNTPEPAAAPEMGIILRLEATQRSWVSVTIDGKVAYEANMEAGQVLEWRGREVALLRTGNAGGLRIWYNGQEEPPIGAAGAVVERTWTAGPLPASEGTEAPAEGTPGPMGPPPEASTATLVPG